MGAVGGPVDTVAVVGMCEPERSRYAVHACRDSGRMLVPAQRLRAHGDPVEEAVALAPWAGHRSGALCEFPAHVSPDEIISGFARSADYLRLSALVCVVDATHFVEELRDDEYLPRPCASPMESTTQHVARAMLSVLHVEFASVIAVINWQGLSPERLSGLLALLAALAPSARLCLEEIPEACRTVGVTASEGVVRRPADSGQVVLPGWVALLNGDHAPSIRDSHVTAFHYEQVRPFHPARLQSVLDDRIETGEFGTVLRSAGLCRLASRAGLVGQWQHVGAMLSLEPAGADDVVAQEIIGGPDVVDEVVSTGNGVSAGAELLCVGQDLGFIGIDLDVAALSAALDEAALNDREFSGDPADWENLPDPFPVWERA